MENKCSNCGKIIEYKIKENKIDIFRGVNIDFFEKIPYCPECGKELLIREIEEENQKKLLDRYLEITGSINPKEITTFRKDHYLSRGELANLLGVNIMTIYNLESGGFVSKFVEASIESLLRTNGKKVDIARKKFISGEIGRRTYEKIIKKADNFYEKKDFEDELAVYKIISKEYIKQSDGRPSMPTKRHGFKRFEFCKLENIIAYICSKRKFTYEELNVCLWIIDYYNFNKKGSPVTGLPYSSYNGVPSIDREVFNKIISTNSDMYYVENTEGNLINSRENYNLNSFSEEELLSIASAINSEEGVIHKIKKLFTDINIQDRILDYSISRKIDFKELLK